MFHGKSILRIDWENISFINANVISQLRIPYLVVSILTAFFVCLIFLLLYYEFKIDKVKQLEHRESLARMILENGWYEREQTQSSGFFKDLGGSSTKERISSFPRMYYYMKDGLIHINVKITMGKYQDQLLSLETKLESGLYCELVDKELMEGYVEYTLLYDTIGSRITIDDIIAENGSIKLMKSVYWEYDSLPHALIIGGTGGGKSYFILTLIRCLLTTNSKIYILDPKNSDLADLGAVMDNVYYKTEDMIACLNQFYEDMMQRNENMKKMKGYKTGQNYAYLGLPAHFLIFDEYVAFMNQIGRQSVEVMSKLSQIVMLGRQAGFFLILACQRPDAKYLGDGIRDQFNFRVALGRNSDLGYTMAFGETSKKFFNKRTKGRGYVDTGGSVVSEFYTPLVDKNYDFIQEIGKLANRKPTKITNESKED